MKSLLRFAVLICAPVALYGANVDVSWGKEPIKMSSTGPENLLPSFFFMAGGEEGGAYVASQGYSGGLGVPSPFHPPDSCPDDVFDNTMKDLRVPVMPYLEQDDWGCERKPSNETVIVAETDQLRAAITPQWGGKVWSLYHKKYKRHMVFNNPAHQPSNIGYRKAWSSGGAEWNWGPGYIGHSVFTEETVYSATIPSERGDIVRVWDFDRLNNTVWQVDILFENDVMWAHPKITNPNDAVQDGYWWTCVAMPVTDKTRIVAPATESITPCSPWPYGSWNSENVSFKGPDLHGCAAEGAGGRCAWQQDMSYLGNIPESHDFFFRIPKTRLPHVTHVREDGFAVIHSHPAWMNGTKFFQWGANPFGEFNQDFLSGSDYTNPKCYEDMETPVYDPFCSHYKHEGKYTELQVGPAASQMHTFPIKPKSEYQWTEWFKAWFGNATRLHAADYREPVAAVDEWIASKDGMPQAEIDAVDAFLEKMSSVPPRPENMLTVGQPWGALHEAATGVRLAPGAPFNATELLRDARARPWVELVQDGTFSATTLRLTPTSYQTSDMWMGRLLRSIAEGHDSWLHRLHLASCYLERGEVDPARVELERSLALRPGMNPVAARNLAAAAPNASVTAAYYARAWKEWQALDLKADPAAERLGKDLGREMCAWYTGSGDRWDELRAFLAALPDVAGLHRKDQVLHARAALAVHDGEASLANLTGVVSADAAALAAATGNATAAIDLLTSSCYPTYGNMRSKLLNLWLRAQVLKERYTVKAGHPLTRRELIRLKKRIGCDGYSGTASTPSGDPTEQTCKVGPPNIGYPY